MTASSAASEQVRLGRRILTAFLAAVTAAAYAPFAALPAAPFRLPFVDREQVHAVLPEGWAFFTRSPREPELTSYRLDPDGTWQLATQRSSMSFASALGLNRRDRAQGTELAAIVNPLAAADWTPCGQAPIACLAEAGVARTLPNRSTHPTLCGEVGLVVQDVLPWAWYGLPTVMHSQVSRVRVSC